MLRTRNAPLALALALCWTGAARAGAPTPPAAPPGGQAATAEHVTNARAFLQDTAKMSLQGFIQLGCTLKGVNTNTVTRHANGTFTVSVRYDWSGLDNGKDFTEIHYAFDNGGRISGLKVGRSSPIVFTPYSVLDFGLDLTRARDALLKELQQLAPNNPIRRRLEPLVAGANARTIHLLTLRFRQPR